MQYAKAKRKLDEAQATSSRINRDLFIHRDILDELETHGEDCIRMILETRIADLEEDKTEASNAVAKAWTALKRTME